MDSRLGRRVVKSITEVTGNVTEENIPVLQDLFTWEDGRLCCTGVRPYPLLGRMLDEAGFGYDQVMRGEGLPPAWLQEAQQW